MPFYNRKQELDFLNRKYAEKAAQFIPIYGKRRVGKTELTREFFKDKPHIYFLVDKLEDNLQLRDIAHKLGSYFDDSFLAERGF